MKKDLVDSAQPFGEVIERKTMQTTAYMAPILNKRLGDVQEVGNRGVNQPQSNANKAPGAFAYASRNADNPFAPTGHPKK